MLSLPSSQTLMPSSTVNDLTKSPSGLINLQFLQNIHKILRSRDADSGQQLSQDLLPLSSPTTSLDDVAGTSSNHGDARSNDTNTNRSQNKNPTLDDTPASRRTRAHDRGNDNIETNKETPLRSLRSKKSTSLVIEESPESEHDGNDKDKRRFRSQDKLKSTFFNFDMENEQKKVPTNIPFHVMNNRKFITTGSGTEVPPIVLPVNLKKTNILLKVEDCEETNTNDPLSESTFQTYHRKMERDENRMKEIEKGTIYSDVEKLEDYRYKLSLPDWPRSLSSVTSINNPRDKHELEWKKKRTIEEIDSFLTKLNRLEKKRKWFKAYRLKDDEDDDLTVNEDDNATTDEEDVEEDAYEIEIDNEEKEDIKKKKIKRKASRKNLNKNEFYNSIKRLKIILTPPAVPITRKERKPRQYRSKPIIITIPAPKEKKSDTKIQIESPESLKTLKIKRKRSDIRLHFGEETFPILDESNPIDFDIPNDWKRHLKKRRIAKKMVNYKDA